MTTIFWLALIAAFVVSLVWSGARAIEIATLSVQQGRLRAAFLSLPAMTGTILGYLCAMGVVAVADLIVPDVVPALGWAGICYIILRLPVSVLAWRRRAPAAANDNYADRRFLRLGLSLMRRHLGAMREGIVLAAFVIQFLDPQQAAIPQLIAAGAALPGILFAGLALALFPRLAPRRRVRRPTSASNKSGTVFIARRAVTAGFRRIAA